MAEEQPEQGWERRYLGVIIVGLALAILGVFGGLAIGAVWGESDATKRLSGIKDILGIELPVLGAWVGTVLAFYFGRENFESAAKSTAALVRQLSPDEKLRSILARAVMIPIEKAVVLKLTAKNGGFNEADLKLTTDVLGKLDGKNRLPILDPDGRIKYVAHRSLIDGFIVKKVLAAKPANPADLTLKDVLNDSDAARIVRESFGTVSPDSPLSEAKALIDHSDIVLDVFVTESGKPTDKVLGWITNVVIREQSKV